MNVRRIVLRSFQSPGDVVMLTAAIRDLHRAHPGQFQTDVRTSADALWENNPFLTPLCEEDSGVELLDAHYPLIHQSNDRPYHFLHGYPQYLSERLEVPIPLTEFKGDIYLRDEEKAAPIPGVDQGVPERFWIVVAGGKYDFTAKWWNPQSYQAVVDHFQGRIQFVQCGESEHWHPPLTGVVNLVGRTGLREFLRLMYHAEGVLCPVTLAMHLAAAVPTRPGRPPNRPCVVVAGGREPLHWEAYPHHQYIGTNGMLSCCGHGGCWKSRCQLVGDGDIKDRKNVCEQPVVISEDLRIPRCLDMITPEDVIRRISMYLEGGAIRASQVNEPIGGPACAFAQNGSGPPPSKIPAQRRQVLIEFRHGLGDAIQLTIVLQHLLHHRPDWDVDVVALRGKHSAFHGLCRRVFVMDDDHPDRAQYDRVEHLDWHECHEDDAAFPGTKAARCLREVFGINLDADLFQYQVPIDDGATRAARRYLAEISGTECEASRFPVVVIHYQGNTSAPKKDLSHALIAEVCEEVMATGYVPLILDWDERSPLPDNVRIHNPGANHRLWGSTDTGDAARIAALIELSALMIGIDSGPLHVAGATSTPTIGVWTRHHPVHYFDLAENVTHLVPEHHGQFAAGHGSLEQFERRYHHAVYEDPASCLIDAIRSRLENLKPEPAVARLVPQPTLRGFGEDYYSQCVEAGLDYLAYGDWQRDYGRWFVESLRLAGRRVLDVGCACGAITRGLHEAGAVAHGIDVSEYMIRRGREAWPELGQSLHVCDAVNLHLYDDGVWDAVHCQQVAQHWSPELVPHILAELRRVTRPGGLLFCTTGGGAATSPRDSQADWWLAQLEQAGWNECSGEVIERFQGSPRSFVRKYDWTWFLARAAGMENIPTIVDRGWHVHEWAVEQDWTIIRDVYEEDCYQFRSRHPRRRDEVLIDVGACIGAFERLARECSPSARIVCVEVCPENLPVLRANVSGESHIVGAALTYERDVALKNAVYPHCCSTGGSIVCGRDEVRRWEESPDERPREYFPDYRTVTTVTLEQLLDEFDLDFVDVLKLDCEGSEFSILTNCDLNRIGEILGEYHGRERFDHLCTDRFSGGEWDVHITKPGEIGLFQITRRNGLPASYSRRP